MNEENDQSGAQVYAENRKDQLKDHVFAMESDFGVFKPWGIAVTGSDRATAILHQIGERFLSGFGSGNVTTRGKQEDRL